jgi:DNA-binding IclR family transcriptional regulator
VVPTGRRPSQDRAPDPPTDAVSCSVPTFRLDDERAKRLVSALLEEQARLA